MFEGQAEKGMPHIGWPEWPLFIGLLMVAIFSLAGCNFSKPTPVPLPTIATTPLPVPTAET